MNRTSVFRALIALLGVQVCASSAAVTLTPPGSEVSTLAQYQTAIDGPHLGSAGQPGNVTDTAAAGPGGSVFAVDEGVALIDGAEAIARSNLPGTIGSYSHAGGFSPSFGAGATSNVRAESEVRQTTHWIASTNDPTITTAQINLAAFYDGSLFVASYGGANQVGQVYADVHASMSTNSSLGSTTWFDADARLDRFGGVNASANWVASFTNATVSPFSISYVTTNYFDVFPNLITVPTNEMWSFESVLGTDAFVHGPFENWAVSNFLASGDFELVISTPGVTLSEVTAVPLPGGIWLFGVAGFGLVTRLRGKHHPSYTLSRIQRAKLT